MFSWQTSVLKCLITMYCHDIGALYLWPHNAKLRLPVKRNEVNGDEVAHETNEYNGRQDVDVKHSVHRQIHVSAGCPITRTSRYVVWDRLVHLEMCVSVNKINTNKHTTTFRV